MATIMNDAAYMGFPLSIKRGNPAPVDTTAVWYNKTELETYATSGATAYVGQILTLVADNKCEAYMISNEAGTLIKLASTTASGDLASDVATLQGQVADLISKVGKAAEGEVAATGLYKEIADVLAVANNKVASVTAADKSITIDGTATAPTVKVTISEAEGNALSLADDGLKVVIPKVTVPEYSMKKLDTATTGMSASYQLTKNGTGIGTIIDIPKDMVVSSGTVETFKAGALPTGVTEPGTYIVLVLANATNDSLYIKVDGLIEYVTGGSDENDAIQINVTSDTHKVSASVKNGSLTLAMLSSDVQTSLGKADSAVQEVKAGTANGTISVDGTDIAVTGLADAAYVTVASLNETAQGKADAAKAEIIGGKDDNDAALSIYGAKAYAKAIVDSTKADLTNDIKTKIEGLDVTDTAVAKQFVSAVSETDGKIAVERRALLAEDVPALGISKISGLQDALDTKQDSVTFDGTYSATNKAATVKTVTDAVSAVVSNGDDKAADDTIKGAKLYADNKASAAETAAKAYADSVAAGAQGGLLGATGDTSDKTTIYGTRKYAEEKATAAQTAAEKTAADALSPVSKKVTANETAIGVLNGTGDGSISKSISDKVAGLKNTDTAETGKFVTAVKESNGIVSVERAALTANDIPTLTHTKISDWDTELAKKQDVLGIADGYDKTNNQVATVKTVTDAVAGLSGAMHFIGAVESLPATTDGYNAGDVITVGKKEYVVSKDNTWILLGDEGSYAVKGSIANADIASDAAIDQSKINGLPAALTARYTKEEANAAFVAKETGKRLITDAEAAKLDAIAENAQVNVIESVKVNGTALTITDKAVNIQVSDYVDGTSIEANSDGKIAIKKVSTDLLEDGTNTLILNCGTAANLT